MHHVGRQEASHFCALDLLCTTEEELELPYPMATRNPRSSTIEQHSFGVLFVLQYRCSCSLTLPCPATNHLWLCEKLPSIGIEEGKEWAFVRSYRYAWLPMTVAQSKKCTLAIC